MRREPLTPLPSQVLYRHRQSRAQSRAQARRRIPAGEVSSGRNRGRRVGQLREELAGLAARLLERAPEVGPGKVRQQHERIEEIALAGARRSDEDLEGGDVDRDTGERFETVEL